MLVPDGLRLRADHDAVLDHYAPGSAQVVFLQIGPVDTWDLRLSRCGRALFGHIETPPSRRVHIVKSSRVSGHPPTGDWGRQEGRTAETARLPSSVPLSMRSGTTASRPKQRCPR